MLAALGLSGLDLDEHTRLAQAVARPSRVDAQVIRNLAATLAHSKRLEDKLGPTEVVDTVLAQHHLVRVCSPMAAQTSCDHPCLLWRATWPRRSVAT